MDLVQLGDHDPRDVSSLQRHLEGLLRAPKLRRDTETDVFARKELAESTGLVDSRLRETLPWGGVRSEPCIVRPGKRVAREKDGLHRLEQH